MHAGKAGTVRPSYKIVTGLERLAKECGVPTEPSVVATDEPSDVVSYTSVDAPSVNRVF